MSNTANQHYLPSMVRNIDLTRHDHFLRDQKEDHAVEVQLLMTPRDVCRDISNRITSRKMPNDHAKPYNAILYDLIACQDCVQTFLIYEYANGQHQRY